MEYISASFEDISDEENEAKKTAPEKESTSAPDGESTTGTDPLQFPETFKENTDSYSQVISYFPKLLIAEIPFTQEDPPTADPFDPFPADLNGLLQADINGLFQDDPDVSFQGEPNIPFPDQLSGVFQVDPNVHLPADSDVSFPVDPNVLLPADPNVSFQTDPNVSFQVDPNVPLPDDPNISFQADQNISFQVDPNVLFSADPIVPFSVDPNVPFPEMPDDAPLLDMPDDAPLLVIPDVHHQFIQGVPFRADSNVPFHFIQEITQTVIQGVPTEVMPGVPPQEIEEKLPEITPEIQQTDPSVLLHDLDDITKEDLSHVRAEDYTYALTQFPYHVLSEASYEYASDFINLNSNSAAFHNLPAFTQEGLLENVAAEAFPDMHRSFTNYAKMFPKQQVYEDVSDDDVVDDDDEEEEEDEEFRRKVEQLREITKLQDKEIHCKIHFLMHAFGDVGYPLAKSVFVMHDFLDSQMLILVEYLEDIAKLKKPSAIDHEVVLFLMRKNKVLLRRLMQFLYIKGKAGHMLPGFVEFRGSKTLPKTSKLVETCFNFLSDLEIFTGDIDDLFNDKIFDHAMQKRLERRLLLQTSRSEEQRQYFKVALKVTLDKYAQSLQKYTGLCITPLAALIIEFLAMETIAGLVEKALYLRSRKCRGKKLPLLSPFDFHSSVESNGDDKLSNDSTLAVDKQFSYTPQSYLKDSFINSECKMFYQDSAHTDLPKVVRFPYDSKPKALPKDFIQPHGCNHLNILMKKESEKKLLLNDPITPDELQAAFIHYHSPHPFVVLMKPQGRFEMMSKKKLISISLYKEEFKEEI